MDMQSTIAANTNQLAVKSAQLNLSRLLVGQILNATVVENKTANSLILKIGNQLLEARATQNKTLNVGEQLKLIVEKQNNPTTLRVIQHDPKVIAQEAKQQLQQQLLREAIPKQAGLEKLTTLLNQVTNNIKASVKNLPAPIEQQFKKLIEQLPSKNNLDNEAGLRTAIKNSGIFLEAKLLTEAFNKDGKKLNSLFKNANIASQETSSQLSKSNQALLQTQKSELTKDLKANLLQLSAAINKHKTSSPLSKTSGDATLIKSFQVLSQALSHASLQASFRAPSIEITNKNAANTKEATIKTAELALKAETETLNKQIESSVARIEVNQSKAIISNDNQPLLWSIELPVKDEKDFDLLELNIHADKDSNNDDEKEQLWSTDLKITFENIGTLSAKIAIIEKEVNATLWSDNETLNSLIDNNLSVLNKKIELHGLTTGKITRLKEAPIEQDLPRTNNNLISITI
jgi:hypothetical protein